jgi:hypothetical protein
MTLPADVARCIGTDLPECTTCRRRTEPPHERQVWTGPWELEGVPCEMRIPSDELSAVRRVVQNFRNPQAEITHLSTL